MFLNKGTDLFERKIFRSKEKKIGIKIKNSDCDINKFSFRLFINITKILNNTKKTCHIISVILKSSNHNENSKLCNEQIINLVNGERNGHKSFFLLNNIPEEVEDLLKKDTFVAIQLWNRRWESEKDNTFDAKTYVKENPYYFYSILTSEKKIFRRSYENIMDVLGWCQSASSAYFDVFYGTTCLELTIKPKKEICDETGHDSEEFRIWELLALQKKLLDKINKKEMNNVDDYIKELDKIYNFSIFTKKIGKGEKWIRYGEYLQKITGIDSAYQDYKIKIERKNKEHESKLQKLNFLIVVSILASFLTLLLSPIYSSLISSDNSTSLNSTINSTINSNFYFTHIFQKTNSEFKAIVLALIITFVSCLWIIRSEKKKYLIIVIIVLIILVILFIIY